MASHEQKTPKKEKHHHGHPSPHLILGVAVQGIAFAAIVLAPTLHAWTDGLLGRIHHGTADEDRN